MPLEILPVLQSLLTLAAIGSLSPSLPPSLPQHQRGSDPGAFWEVSAAVLGWRRRGRRESEQRRRWTGSDTRSIGLGDHLVNNHLVVLGQSGRAYKNVLQREPGGFF